MLCQTSLLLRQLALRATSTGRPLIVVADDAQRWSPIVASAATGKLVEAVPEDVPEDAILVIEGQCPLAVPEVTVLTNDASRGADVELVDADDQYTFTLKTRSGLSARVRAVPTHEERRLLGSPSARRPPPRRAAEARRPTGPTRRPRRSRRHRRHPPPHGPRLPPRQPARRQSHNSDPSRPHNPRRPSGPLPRRRARPATANPAATEYPQSPAAKHASPLPAAPTTLHPARATSCARERR
ncbi:hypothetical protein I552_0695 [Mycobacterium xenopi 3993]|nr:hypothetical protein I552_0695 [Mycobacterium xenopi 3993]